MPVAHCLGLLALLVGWWPAPLAAQQLAPADFRFGHLTVNEGLSHSDAMAVAQDAAGFIWIGTNRGLDRYDGLNMRTYTQPRTREGLSGNRIRALLAAPDGRLWVGAERAGLSYYEPAADSLLPLAAISPAARPLLRQLATASVTALATDATGRVWVGTQQHGIFVLVPGRGRQLKTAYHLPQQHAGSDYSITSLAADAEGNVWLGTQQHGLQVVRPASLVAQPTEVTAPVQALCLDRRGDLWVGLNRRVLWVGTAQRRAGHGLAAQALSVLVTNNVQALHLDSFGRLWVGTLYGLYVWPAGPTTGQAPPVGSAPALLMPQDGEPLGLNSERVHQILEDRTQVLWLCASAGGLNRVDLRQKPFGQLRQLRTGRATLANNYINAIYPEAATNTVWLGTRNGVAAYDQQGKTFRYYLNQAEGDPNGRGIDVSTIFPASDGTLWLAGRNYGLAALRRRPGQPEQLTRYDALPSGRQLNSIGPESIVEDEYQTLWVATFDGGLLRLSLSGQVLSEYRLANKQLPTNHLTYLLYDRRQRVLWASTADAGLLKLHVGRPGDSPQLLQQFHYRPGQATGLQVNYVWPLLLDRKGTLWVGTIGGGLYQLVREADGREQLRSMRKFLPESDVESIQADDQGNLWLGSTGLYRYTPATQQYVRYDVADGLQSNSFKIGSSARGADGTLYFGGINGVSYFQPAAIRPNPHAPVVQVTGLRITNQLVAVGQAFNGRVVLRRPLTEPQVIALKPGENDFSVEFVGLNYVNPQKNQYAYLLEGYNKKWVYPAPGQRTAGFTNLPPGRYTLRVKASNGEGLWSVPVTTLTFDVRAPWYRMPWAYALYVALALGVVALYRRIEMRQQALRNKLAHEHLQAEQELRSKLAREHFQAEQEKALTNLKLAFFTDLSHELRTPLTLILGPMEEIIRQPSVPDLPDKLQLMQRQAQKLLDLVTQLLDFRKVESGHVPLRAALADATPFLTELYASFRHKAQERGVRYVLDLPAEPVLLYFDRDKLETIVTNLLANAFKFVRDQGRVELAATVVGLHTGEAVYEAEQLVGNYLRISVTDTGVGIAPFDLERIFDPYYQAAHTTSLRQAGTGIGLSLARQFAQRHGGRLLVSSTQGLGSTFELHLPLGRHHLNPDDLTPMPTLTVSESVASVADATAPAAAIAHETARPHLLVVEDHTEVREYLCQLFAADYQVQAAEDGEAGWQAALRRPPDLVISDVMMPRLDGLALCQRLKQHAKTSHVPVLLLTARTAETHQLEGLGLGADAYVNKPFNPALLQAQAAALLQGRRRLHEFYQRNTLLQPTEIVVADADREFLQRAMNIVEQRLSDANFSVTELSDGMAMSQSAFYRRLKSLTGQTMVEFVRDVRLKLAAQLLINSTLNVSEVAYEVGMDNVKYFRQVFQKVYGVSPSEYARQHRGVAAGPVVD